MERIVKKGAWPDEPYSVGGAVSDDARFAGRKELLKRLHTLIADPNRTGFILQGPRRFGKSSVLERCAKTLRGDPCEVTLDLSKILDLRKQYLPHDVARTVLLNMLRFLRSRFTSVPDECWGILELPTLDIERFKAEALPRLLSSIAPKRLIVFLDEMEVAEYLDPLSPNEICDLLLPPIEYLDLKPFLGIIWGRAYGRGVSSEFPGAFKDFYRRSLERFSDAETKQALTQPVAGTYEWDGEALAEAIRLGSGDPLFTACLGAAVHEARGPGDNATVSLKEVSEAVEKALQIGFTWDDAWSQLDIRQKLLLRVVAERPAVKLGTVPSVMKEWGIPDEFHGVDNVIRGVVEDGILHVSSSALTKESLLSFKVPLMEKWVLERSPHGILNDFHGAYRSSAGLAIRHDQAGREYLRKGQPNEAAQNFVVALEHDSQLSDTAVLLARILLTKNRPEEAVRFLSATYLTTAVKETLAIALTRCLEHSIERYEDAAGWIEELRLVDPYFRSTPQASKLVTQVAVDAWWNAVKSAPSPIDAIRETDHLLSERRGMAIDGALRRCSLEVERWLAGDSQSDGVKLVMFYVLPYLLRESDPTLSEPVVGLSDGSDGTEENDPFQWKRTYRAEVHALQRLSPSLHLGSDGIPPISLLRLLECEGASASMLDEVRGLVLQLASIDRLVLLAFSDSSQATTTAVLLERTQELAAVDRLQKAFDEAVLTASTCEPAVLMHFMKSLPGFGFALLRLFASLGRISDYSMQRLDLIGTSEVFLDSLGAQATSAIVAFDPEAAADLEAFLQALVDFEPSRVGRLKRQLEEIRGRIDSGDGAAVSLDDVPLTKRIDATKLKGILGGAYRVGRPVAYRIFGVPAGCVLAWIVDRDGMTLLARAYRVEGSNEQTKSFLSHIWDNERRLLSNLGTRWEGRALPRLYISRFDKETSVLVLVTEYVGSTTLRDLLRDGKISQLRAASRSKLWTQLQGLIEATASLHRAGYIHRAIRPENILVDIDGHAQHNRPWLRLANFEWVVYLYSLAGSSPEETSLYDRYISPERLAVNRPDEASGIPCGEGPASDAFALGLLLFECLVDPLDGQELTPIPSQYSVRDYVGWIESIVERIDDAFTTNRLWSDEVHLLKSLLTPDPRRRCADLDSILDTISQFTRREAPGGGTAQPPLQLVTTLHLRTNESIARFIQEQIPDQSFEMTSDLGNWLEEELRDAKVYSNRRLGAQLFLIGKRLNYTVEPFHFKGVEHRHVGWLKVATRNDEPVGLEVIHEFPGVKIHNYHGHLKMAELLSLTSSWVPLFSAVERLHEGLTIDQRAFIERVRWTVNLERASWEVQVLPYELVEYLPGKRPGDRDVAIIKDRRDDEELRNSRLKLVDLLAQSVDRDNVWFELGLKRDPTAGFTPDRRWIQIESGKETGPELVRLERFHREGVGTPPHTGWIRPYSLAGHRALYERRKQVLDDVERDPFLINSIFTPNETFDDLQLPAGKPFNNRLDEDKTVLSREIRNRGPLFILQGPPGTGKTTLATEIILQTLRDQPSSHILVVAQAHDPLNHLLLEVEKNLDGWRQQSRTTQRPTTVRLTSQERLDERRYGKEATLVPRKYHPSRQAKEIMMKAAGWRPRKEDRVAESALKSWKLLLETHALHGLSSTLERRIVDSANIVFATTNDRELAAIRPGSFDFVIYEEAAKALPAEVLGPLRLGRRWLLIGDQAQLPPFGLDFIDDVLQRDIQRLKVAHRRDPQLAAEKDGVDPAYILGDIQTSPDKWADITLEMNQLLRFFNYIYERARRVPLGDPAPGPVEGLAGMLQTQWRMHPVIGNLVSKCFYKGRVRNGDPDNLGRLRSHRLTFPPQVEGRAILWLDIPQASEQEFATERKGFGGGYENGFEARVVIGFLRQLLAGIRQAPSLAILSPYRAQISTFARLIRDFQFPGEIDLSTSLHTVDSFQGKQADVVVISLVRNRKPGPESSDEQQIRDNLGFLNAAQRSTVMFSRAEKLLVIVGCMRHYKQFPNTIMYDVAQEVETLSKKDRRHVGIIPGDEFLTQKHWADLERFHRTRSAAAAQNIQSRKRDIQGRPK